MEQGRNVVKKRKLEDNTKQIKKEHIVEEKKIKKEHIVEEKKIKKEHVVEEKEVKKEPEERGEEKKKLPFRPDIKFFTFGDEEDDEEYAYNLNVHEDAYKRESRDNDEKKFYASLMKEETPEEYESFSEQLRTIKHTYSRRRPVLTTDALMSEDEDSDSDC
ncbi:hypothetical protein TNIN_429321 [Trichonephila inaurata madagascariensis]|uniref:Uncharacterized protein n=1 Tax=Trichonephila inaurata madagascariensis TaxID=2747483 RepID=A0A8X6ME83_9ARAC|nr:hypothetical protein TNIN_429321 [Trichonephila inaurata madagascariensis]